MSAFGPTLLAQGARAQRHPGVVSLGLVFHYADQAGLPLLDLADLREVVKYLTSDEGKADLKELGGLSERDGRRDPARADRASPTRAPTRSSASRSSRPATCCGSPPDGKGMISLVELPNLQDRPALFSTFLMWLLADLFHDLPEVGDVDKPKLVFFFDEAHLLFDDASKAFLDAIAQTVRLIRSKGVGVFFVTQSPDRRTRRRARPARLAHPAPAARRTPPTTPRRSSDGEHLPALGLRRPRPGDPLPRHRRGDRDGDERARRADPGRLDPAARARVADGRRRPGRDGAGGRRPRPLQREVRRGGRPRVRPREARRQAGGGCRARPARSRRQPPGSRPTRRRRRSCARRATARPASATASPRKEKSMAEEILTSTTARQLGRTAVREIFRGMFKTGRR